MNVTKRAARALALTRLRELVRSLDSEADELLERDPEQALLHRKAADVLRGPAKAISVNHRRHVAVNRRTEAPVRASNIARIREDDERMLEWIRSA